MPTHTITENLQRLVTVKTNIANAITEMGGTVNDGDGFEAFPADIATIPTGGSENELEIHVDDISISVTSQSSSISKTNSVYAIDFIPITGSGTISKLVNAGAYLEWSADISWFLLIKNASFLTIKCGFGCSDYSTSTTLAYFSEYLNTMVSPKQSIDTMELFYGSKSLHYQSMITSDSGNYMLFNVNASPNAGTILQTDNALHVSNISGKLIIPNS